MALVVPRGTDLPKVIHAAHIISKPKRAGGDDTIGLMNGWDTLTGPGAGGGTSSGFLCGVDGLQPWWCPGVLTREDVRRGIGFNICTISLGLGLMPPKGIFRWGEYIAARKGGVVLAGAGCVF